MSFDVYNNAVTICKKRVCKALTNSFTKGFESAAQELETVKPIVALATAYHDSWTVVQRAHEKVQAAKTLGLDAFEYENEYVLVKAEQDALLSQLEEFVNENSSILNSYY